MASVRAAATAEHLRRADRADPGRGRRDACRRAGFFSELRAWCTPQRRPADRSTRCRPGLGRTGRWFAFEHEGIRPDALILGKALGGGLLPVSAFLADAAVMDVFNPGSHGSTFGGNALAAAVALEGLQVIEDENLVSAQRGAGRLPAAAAAARCMQPAAALIRDVRGRGLWVGVDIEPAHAQRARAGGALAAHGVLSKETHETVIRFAPPLTITQALIDRAVEIFREVARRRSMRELGLGKTCRRSPA